MPKMQKLILNNHTEFHVSVLKIVKCINKLMRRWFFSYVFLKLMHDSETAKFESSQTDADKDSRLLGYYTVLMSSSFPHFRGAVLLQNEANILQTQQNTPDSLDLDNVAVYDNICKFKTLLPFCTHYTDETLDAFQGYMLS
jgi:hypothetical protein